MATYGTSANGTEGPSKINVLNLNLFSTRHREQAERVPRDLLARGPSALRDPLVDSRRHGDRDSARRSGFGNPFFLAPNVDELVKRFQLKDNFSIVTGTHTIKAGGEWLHTNNAQVFRGFFEGRYMFDSVTGFLRYASPAAPGGFGPNTVGCSNGSLRDAPGELSGRDDGDRRAAAVLPAEQQSRRHRARRGWRLRHQQRTSSRSSSRTSGRPGHGLTVDYGLRWDAQTMPETVDPNDDRLRAVPRTIRGFRPTARFPISGSSFSRVSGSPGTSRRTASPSCAAAPASTTPGRTC